MENKQQIDEALEELLKKNKEDPINSILEEYLCKISSTGVTEFTWSRLKPLISRKLEGMMDDFMDKEPTKQIGARPNVENVTFEEMKQRIYTYLDVFNGIPFTIQRLCELLTNKQVLQQYKNAEKYMRGIEKNLMVVTTVDPTGRRIVNEPKATNGLMSEGVTKRGMEAPLSNSTPKGEVGKEGDSPRKSTASWFSCLSDVVESPHSYPTWNHPAKSDAPQLSSHFKRMGNGDMKDAESNAIFSSKFKSLSTEDDFEASQPVSKAIKLDEDAMKEEEIKKAERQQPTPLLSELLNSSSGSLTQPSTHPPLTIVCSPSQDKKSSSERKSPILATSVHQGEGVPTNIVHPLQQNESCEQLSEKEEVALKEDSTNGVCSSKDSTAKEGSELKKVSALKEVVSACMTEKTLSPVEEESCVSGEVVMEGAVKTEVNQENLEGLKEDDEKAQQAEFKSLKESSETSKLIDPPLTNDKINVA